MSNQRKLYTGCFIYQFMSSVRSCEPPVCFVLSSPLEGSQVAQPQARHLFEGRQAIRMSDKCVGGSAGWIAYFLPLEKTALQFPQPTCHTTLIVEDVKLNCVITFLNWFWLIKDTPPSRIWEFLTFPSGSIKKKKALWQTAMRSSVHSPPWITELNQWVEKPGLS